MTSTMLIPAVTPREFSSKITQVSNPLPATFADWLALPEDRGAELLYGRIEYKAMPSLEHGRVQRKLGRFVDPFDHRRGSGNNPGGWWIGSEVDVIINGHGVRPDMVGWRRDKFPRKPRPNDKGAIDARPDWIAEVLSPSNRERDLKDKFVIYQDAGVPYYWILDPDARSLLVHTKHPAGYILVDGGGSKRILRPQPFQELELRIGSLFAEDNEEDDEEEDGQDDDFSG